MIDIKLTDGEAKVLLHLIKYNLPRYCGDVGNSIASEPLHEAAENGLHIRCALIKKFRKAMPEILQKKINPTEDEDDGC